MKQIVDNYSKNHHSFLEFQINRNVKCTKIAGGLIDYIILQVIAYHHFISVINIEENSNFDNAVYHWKKSEVLPKQINKKLTLSSLSAITKIDKETVRRTVKRLSKNQWVNFTKEFGVQYSPNKENQSSMIELAKWELDETIKWTNKLLR